MIHNENVVETRLSVVNFIRERRLSKAEMNSIINDVFGAARANVSDSIKKQRAFLKSKTGTKRRRSKNSRGSKNSRLSKNSRRSKRR